MKKIFTIIVFAAGTISAASAQSKTQKSFAYNDKKISNVYDQHSAFDKQNTTDYFSAKEKAARLQKINREFDQKIAFIKSNRRLSGREKAKQVQILQSQRKTEISKVEYQFAKSNQQKAYSKAAGHKW